MFSLLLKDLNFSLLFVHCLLVSFEISFTFSTGLHVHVGVRDKVLLLKPDRHGKWQRVSCYEKSRCDACCTFHNGSLTDVI